MTSSSQLWWQLPISSQAPIYHLRPDPLFPSISSACALCSYDPPAALDGDGPVQLQEGDAMPPSMLRRSRQARNGAHFTSTTPLPLEFPYADLGDLSASGVERHLASLEPDLERWPGARETGVASSKARQKRLPRAQLLSLSPAAVRDCVPSLKDAREALDRLRERKEAVYGSSDDADQSDGLLFDVRDVKDQTAVLTDLLAGKLVRIHAPSSDSTAAATTTTTTTASTETEKGFAPWSACYGGHQFGSWASQLGDGRAISILSTPAPEAMREQTGFSALEFQLKGAGRTPYSRFADGLAVLRSSVREYLGSEAMAALHQPTSRALSLVNIPSTKVLRERLETAAVVCRIAPSWIRIGNFEICSSRKQWDSLSQLSSFVGRQVFELKDEQAAGDGEPARSLALEVLRRVALGNARMIAGWQAVGFMHGVMNTDNISVTGACIDYGPYAFMDVFDPHHVCNHSDDLGRYSYRNQPTMGLFAIAKLFEALDALIGFELEMAESAATAGAAGSYSEAPSGWADDCDEPTMDKWRERAGVEFDKLKGEFMEVFKAQYTDNMRQKLGLAQKDEGDFELVSEMLDLMSLHELDYSHTWRLLSSFPGTSDQGMLDRFLDLLLPLDKVASPYSDNCRPEWTKWLERYESRLASEGSQLVQGAETQERMNKVNPRFVLRQWVLEEVIEKTEQGDLKALDRVLDMCLHPFEPYGELTPSRDGLVSGEQSQPTDEERERTRLCGIGDVSMLGFQCSCSS